MTVESEALTINKTAQKTTQLNRTQKIKHKIQQNETILVPSTFTTLGQETRWQCSRVGLPLTSGLLLEYSSEYLNEYSSTR